MAPLTLGGPRITPLHRVKVMSSSSSRPQLTVPSPTPFWPSSSSSRSRKFLGTLTPVCGQTHNSHTVIRTHAQFQQEIETELWLAVVKVWAGGGMTHSGTDTGKIKKRPAFHQPFDDNRCSFMSSILASAFDNAASFGLCSQIWWCSIVKWANHTDSWCSN